MVNAQSTRPAGRALLSYARTALTEPAPVGSYIRWPGHLRADSIEVPIALNGLGTRQQAHHGPQGVGRITMPKRASAAVTSEVGTAAVFTVTN